MPCALPQPRPLPSVSIPTSKQHHLGALDRSSCAPARASLRGRIVGTAAELLRRRTRRLTLPRNLSAGTRCFRAPASLLVRTSCVLQCDCAGGAFYLLLGGSVAQQQSKRMTVRHLPLAGASSSSCGRRRPHACAIHRAGTVNRCSVVSCSAAAIVIAPPRAEPSLHASAGC
ncbi:hypothetical protein BU23DRAFT_255523 [Bimuria novae-zelandiae CBS 107.79]|uniref:Uncharacterized protein n=1 Tax=Bimuria novae-zelandiae CBS 107.79 TaxID=1447943 RepID=A0A6A5UVU5_9PLEO|nr:hypothetical protein BU23DRAFT_255523 [Bimuria novae-zelandiae CBS 107.79]